uniref:Uncharacterized protein n=1 Tax=Rhizophora mucronata TaxID=61149 RepID=A0A2P2P4P3_RHIMU
MACRQQPKLELMHIRTDINDMETAKVIFRLCYRTKVQSVFSGIADGNHNNNMS